MITEISDATDSEDENPQSASDEDILAAAKARFKLAAEAETSIRKHALEDLKFSAGDQWPADVMAARNQDARPCLTINRIPQFIRQITNDQKQNRPGIKVSPCDSQADVDTAKVFQGLIRHIEESSNADFAYETAFESAVTVGFGYFRIRTQYTDPDSFDQDIVIERIRNRFSVYLDPSYQQPDGSDADWGSIHEDVPEDLFKLQYPKAKLSAMSDWTSIGDNSKGWVNKETVRVAEYFYKEYEEKTICKLSDGSSCEKDELPEGAQVIDQKTTMVPVVKWIKHNGIEILDRKDWAGKWIPIIPVLGQELDIDGERVLEGVVRHAKDPQRMYNYWSSSETETIALAPRAPWIGFAGQFKGYEAKWSTANTKNHAFLEVNQVGLNGQPVPLPQRNVYEPAVQAISQARSLAADDLKATTGIYDASLGNRSNESSGVAIQRRNVQSQTSNFHFVDNLTKSIRHTGRILVDLIPHIYDAPRVIRTVGDDGATAMVTINAVFMKQGEHKMHQMNVGKYDVTVSSGPSFETKRQEAVMSMLDLSKANPQLMQSAGDLLVRNMDWPGAQEIADRLKKLLPPGLADDPHAEKKPLPPEVQNQMSQMGKMIDDLTKQLNVAHDERDQKLLELNQKERIEMRKLDVQVEIALAEMQQTDSITMLKQQHSELSQRLQMLHSAQTIDQEYQSDQQAQQQMQAQQQAQSQQPPGPAQDPNAAPQGQPPTQVQTPTGGSSPGNSMGAP